MIAVVAPEPSQWLRSLLQNLCGTDEQVVVYAPWALPSFVNSLKLPALKRRTLVGKARVKRVHGFIFVEAVSRIWTRQQTHRLMNTRFAIRRMVGIAASHWLPKEIRKVYAPTGAAWELFSKARQRQIETVLIEDLPSLRELHADLDAVAHAHPECLFPHRYRAPRGELVRQESERVLSDVLLVRGRFVTQLRTAQGISASRILRLEGERESNANDANIKRVSERIGNGLHVLLASTACARSGFIEAVTAIERIPDATLFVRKGEGTEPQKLLQHRQVHVLESGHQIPAVDCVVAPSWCESYPSEIRWAEQARVHIVGTNRSLGWLEISPSVREIEPGDVDGLVSAILAGNQ